MSRLKIYDAINGLAVLSLTALLAWVLTAGTWTREDVLFLLVLPLLIIGGAFVVSVLLRRTRPEPAADCAGCLLLPSILVLGAITASALS